MAYQEVQNLLNEYELLLQHIGIDTAARLAPPISDREIADLEEQYQIRLTQDAKAFWQWHNGGEPRSAMPGFFQSLSETLATHKEDREIVCESFDHEPDPQEWDECCECQSHNPTGDLTYNHGARGVVAPFDISLYTAEGFRYCAIFDCGNPDAIDTMTYGVRITDCNQSWVSPEYPKTFAYRIRNWMTAIRTGVWYPCHLNGQRDTVFLVTCEYQPGGSTTDTYDYESVEFMPSNWQPDMAEFRPFPGNNPISDEHPAVDE